MRLAHNLSFVDLHCREGLKRLDAAFLASLPEDLAVSLKAARAVPLQGRAESDLILQLAPELERFLAQLFDIEAEVQSLKTAHDELAPLYRVKRQYIQRRIAKTMSAADVAGFVPERVWDELRFANAIEAGQNLDAYAAWALFTAAGRQAHGTGVLFQVPQKIDPDNLVPLQRLGDGRLCGTHTRSRDGFKLTDTGTDLAGALSEANYCIWCHHQEKDSCRKGLPAKNLSGCPLDEKISEMHEAKAAGWALAALAIICIDNPMCAATGHRICNDCMKACIYQKQQPVDIPQAETRTLKDVLALPWGFEIYSLLTRWNPLNFDRPLPREATGHSVLVVGQGPAGFTLAHHLLNDGHNVVAVDGLKIEPLDIPDPVRDFKELYEELETRTLAGFGGVAEYGITVRWDKNFLKLVRLLLQRRAGYQLYGGVRFGSTLTIADAWRLGFSHIALCMGAGKPTVLEIPNGLANGIRLASDFLMSLQLTGAGQMGSLANLELELPVVVVGGGLTAVDTATEALAYYGVQVERFLRRVEAVGLPQNLSAPEQVRAETFMAHAKALRSTPNKLALLQSWGGATIAYRKLITQAPSYTLNHEEVAKALEEGIFILEEAIPLRVEVDANGHAAALVVKRPEGERLLPARTILVAAGTQPNTVLATEDARLALGGKYFSSLQHPQLTHREPDGRSVSFFGDLHPAFAGNVVKAMASAKAGYPMITKELSGLPPRPLLPLGLEARVVKVERLTPTIVEVVIHAPQAAAHFSPGQFYRLQNYMATAREGLAMEGLAMTGAWVDKEKGLVAVIALEMGGSSSLLNLLQPHDPVVLMGPTGTPTEIPEGENVLLIGGGLGNAVLFSIGAACRQGGNHVTYFAGYKKQADRFRVLDIEAAADTVVWCCDEARGFTPTRPQDSAFHGNMLAALLAHKDMLKKFDRIICIGSDRLMAAVAEARATMLKPYLKSGHVAIGSINSPMQCMMKEICGQCLQRQVDPTTGEETIVFSCLNQDQSLDRVDFACLAARLQQNSLSEKMTAAWQAHLTVRERPA
jgi:NADPH-dependent glutamate synthase beta subunit-like oxidoreductase/NAD(P)H-flavin reductase